MRFEVIHPAEASGHSVDRYGRIVQDGRTRDHRGMTMVLGAEQLPTVYGPDRNSRLAFVVRGNQPRPVAMLGFKDLPSAWDGYERNVNGPIGVTTTMTTSEFNDWAASGRTSEPLPEWHRPCLWAGPDDGPGEVVLKAEQLALFGQGKISQGTGNYLGTDRLGRVHWRAPHLPEGWTAEEAVARARQAVAAAKEGNKGKLPKGWVRPNTTEILPLSDYDHIIVSFSGGKDSLACVLHLLELGVPKEKIELWHQCVDGEPGTQGLMDWPCTEEYCKAIAAELGMPLRFQWKHGGFEGEMTRNESLTQPTSFEMGSGERGTVGGERGSLSTRMRFPQQSGDLSVRWCSAYLKINVATKAINNDPRFTGKKTLMLTGERREESAGRSHYAEADQHPANSARRRVDQWRASIGWPESKVWEIIERHKLRPHPAYELGFGRVSCMACIFGQGDEWATIRALDPARFGKIASYERQFRDFWQSRPGTESFAGTINRKKGVAEQADEGTALDVAGDAARMAMSREYRVPVRVQQWVQPAGAYRTGAGAT